MRRLAVSFLAVSLALAGTLASATPARADVAFDDYFRADQSLRIDYLHTGTHGAEEFNLERLVREGPWPGSRKALVDPTGFGAHRVVVESVAADGTRTELYTRGFCSLLSEWQTTPEARGGMRRAFFESVRIPYPKAKVSVTFLSRDDQGTMQKRLEFDLDPAHHHIHPGRYAPGAFPIVVLQEVGDPANSLDVLILGDGYTEADKEKYHRDLKRFARALFETPPFRDRQDRINLRGLDVFSKDVGPDEPRKGLFKDTALGTTFDTLESARYLTTLDDRALKDIAATAPYDTIVIMVNTSRYGGAGVFNQFSIFPSDQDYDEYVMLHEMGHGFGGLGDEYYTTGVSDAQFYPEGVEPWEPNISALLPDGKPKWADMMAPDTPCPTPADDPKYTDAIGCFEGAGYQAKGLYRPTLDSKMFSKGRAPFGPVNARAISRVIDLYATD